MELLKVVGKNILLEAEEYRISKCRPVYRYDEGTYCCCSDVSEVRVVLGDG